MSGFVALLRGRGRVYLLEAIVCFSGPVLLLGLGLVALPLAFADSTEPLLRWQLTGMLLGGFIGLWGVIQLVLKVAYPRREVASPRAIVFALLIGIGAVLAFYQGMRLSPAATMLLVVMPLLGAAHFLFLGRDYLTRRGS
ncbi:hypothetical protein SAMN05216271_3084 [Halopseudomonas sabulinigri]|uniref:Transmembrane protein n=1 Tax=Halopseudomonas sabulinigri TaxID=472181 RepID=A0A1H1W4B8_9GAMM|nr:hypothetical protein [Halopseudomonas sabulinigri]SDS91511.1 hypothetical protein SAMN05216271_3084 [Halopseudomonas sabulinigri]